MIFHLFLQKKTAKLFLKTVKINNMKNILIAALVAGAAGAALILYLTYEPRSLRE